MQLWRFFVTVGWFLRLTRFMAYHKQGVVISDVRVNDQIRVREVRVIGQNGEQIGVVAIGKALILAQNAGLDLVEVAPEAHPPVCKLMDFGKYKYEAAQKARDAKRNQASTQLKEIRLGLKIDQHDYEVKLGHMRRFLDGGDKVKVMIRFRGREQSRPEMGIKLMNRLAEDIAEDGIVESTPRQDGRNMTMVLAPVKKKTDAVSVQRKRREDERQAKRDAKAERALRNQKRVAEQANAPVLKPLTFSQLGEGGLAGLKKTGGASASKTDAAAAPHETDVKPTPPAAQSGSTKASPAKAGSAKADPKSSSAKGEPGKPAAKRAPRTTTRRTPKTGGETANKTTRSTAKKSAPKTEKTTVGKTEKTPAATAQAETEEK